MLLGPHDTGSAANSSTQDQFYSSGTVPEKVLSGAFGNIDPGRFDSYGAQSEASGDSFSASGHSTGSFQLFSYKLVVTFASLHTLADFGTDGNCRFGYDGWLGQMRS
ncbi:hypothetical protein PM082_014214 [Marasmius tenuissimus]|nr:hypothetical protein PM082_014214 [Marasmius tenuissimus]